MNFTPLYHTRGEMSRTGALPAGGGQREGIPRSAERGQRHTALDPCRLLEKAGENFEKDGLKSVGRRDGWF